MTLTEANKEYDAIADYYDLLYGDRTVDIPFWVELARRYSSPILEFASGTGRLTISIARAGIEIVGLDISEKMLTRGHSHLQKEDVAVQQRVTLLNADMASFEISRTFTAVFSPWGFYVVTDEDQKQCLQSVKKHLQPGGHFVVDIANNKEPTDNWHYHDLRNLKEFPDKGFTLVRQFYQSGDAKTKTAQTIIFLDIVAEDGTMKRFITRRIERIYTKDSLQQLLEENGFTIEEVYGSYNFQPFEEGLSERAILVAGVL